jgi:hypothetical protein
VATGALTSGAAVEVLGAAGTGEALLATADEGGRATTPLEGAVEEAADNQGEPGAEHAGRSPTEASTTAKAAPRNTRRALSCFTRGPPWPCPWQRTP